MFIWKHRFVNKCSFSSHCRRTVWKLSTAIGGVESLRISGPWYYLSEASCYKNKGRARLHCQRFTLFSLYSASRKLNSCISDTIVLSLNLSSNKWDIVLSLMIKLHLLNVNSVGLISMFRFTDRDCSYSFAQSHYPLSDKI